jgi:outer membrane protein TolC
MGRTNRVNNMRWKHVVVGLALTLAGVAGCKQQCFLHECDYEHYRELGPLPQLECDPNASVQPATAAIPAPTTVLDPERPPRYLSLAEAIAIALERGTVGIENPTNPGFGTDGLVGFSGRGITGTDAIRVLAFDPGIISSDIESSLSKFDAQWVTSMVWSATDQPVPVSGLFNNSGESAQFNTALLKPLPTGGVAGITFSTAYQFLSHVATFAGGTTTNPAYTPRLQFQFEQPLLQGYGVEINQLRATHPGSGGTFPGFANPITPLTPTGGRVEGILITRLRFDEERAEFEKNVAFMLLNVENAYWNLYGGYWTLYSREQALRQAFEAWKINKARYEAGRIPIQDFAQTRQQYELFRSQRLTALGAILEFERQLRTLLGLPGEDCTRLVPIDAPTLTPFQPDWCVAVNECLALRPELILARQELKFRQLDLINTKNLLLPDLRFAAAYGLTGLGGRLDGPDTTGPDANAFRSLAADKFTDWSVGLRLNMPIGYRDAHAQTRVARLNLARSYLVVRDQEDRAQRFLELQYRRLFEFHLQIEMNRSQREAAATQLEARFKEFLAGRGTLDILLEAQRVWADALRAEFDAIVTYNNTLAGFEFAKGTLLIHDNVVIGEGPLPHCAQVRAVEHERRKTMACVLLEHADPALNCACEGGFSGLGVPAVPGGSAPAVSTLPLIEGQPPAVHEPEMLPRPRSSGQTGSAPAVPESLYCVPTELPKALPATLPDADKALRSLPSSTPRP